MSCGDVYQRLVTLVNAPDKKQGTALVELLAQLEGLAGQEISLGQFLHEGKSEYLRLLGARGRHHLNLAAQFSGGLLQPDAPAVVPIASEAEQQALRDYYHHAYYAAFFIGRYGLVSTRFYDCNQQKDIPAALDIHAAAVGRSSEVGVRLIRTRRLLEELGDRRNTADYVMNTSRLLHLTVTNEILAFSRQISELYTEWSVP